MRTPRIVERKRTSRWRLAWLIVQCVVALLLAGGFWYNLTLHGFNWLNLLLAIIYTRWTVRAWRQLGNT